MRGRPGGEPLLLGGDGLYGGDPYDSDVEVATGATNNALLWCLASTSSISHEVSSKPAL